MFHLLLQLQARNQTTQAIDLNRQKENCKLIMKLFILQFQEGLFKAQLTNHED